MAKDYYKILGVTENASINEIKRAYRDLAKKYHPDANKGDKNAESKFKEISEAYSVLSSADKKKQYDQMRKFGAYGPGSGGFDFSNFNFNDFSHFGRNHGTGRQSSRGFSIEDLFGSGGFGFGDIFGDIFDRGSKIRRERWGGPQKGESLHVNVEIPFNVSILGGKQIFSITKNDKCSVCQGTGAQPGTKPQACTTCGGKGTLSMSQGFFAVNRPCPNCYGRGEIISNPCKNCNGNG